MTHSEVCFLRTFLVFASVSPAALSFLLTSRDLSHGTGGLHCGERPQPRDLARAHLTRCVLVGSPMTSLALSPHLRAVDQRASEGPACSDDRQTDPGSRRALGTSCRTPFISRIKGQWLRLPLALTPSLDTGQGKTRLIKAPGSRDLTLPSAPTFPHTRVPSPWGQKPGAAER